MITGLRGFDKVIEPFVGKTTSDTKHFSKQSISVCLKKGLESK